MLPGVEWKKSCNKKKNVAITRALATITSLANLVMNKENATTGITDLSIDQATISIVIQSIEDGMKVIERTIAKDEVILIVKVDGVRGIIKLISSQKNEKNDKFNQK